MKYQIQIREASLDGTTQKKAVQIIVFCERKRKRSASCLFPHHLKISGRMRKQQDMTTLIAAQKQQLIRKLR
jgi:hypothetical protein